MSLSDSSSESSSFDDTNDNSTQRSSTTPSVSVSKQTELRKKIIAIQKNTTLSASEKSKQIQLIMNPNSSSRNSTPYKKPKKTLNEDELQKNLTESDKKVSYFDSENKILGCKHYPRGCKYLAMCCETWHVCRLCHNEKFEDHQFPRQKTKFMMCMTCQTVQPWAKSCRNESCPTLALYTCDVCKFHDKTPDKDVYHCDKCGLCRVGKSDSYFHCDNCNACMSIELTDHNCVTNALASQCPICNEDLHTSIKPVAFLPCGHAIHGHCRNRYLQTNYICPLCSKSMIEDMSEIWAEMDIVLATHVMPDEYKDTTASILCNDCSAKSTVPFHFQVHKCTSCGGYNTRVIATQNMPEFPSTNNETEEEKEEEEEEEEEEGVTSQTTNNNE